MKRGYVVIFAQFGLIVFFVYGLSAEYRSNAYQQDWILRKAPWLQYFVNGLSAEYRSNAYQQDWILRKAPWLQYFVNGYLAAMLLGVFIGGGVLLAADYWRNKNKKSSLRTVG